MLLNAEEISEHLKKNSPLFKHHASFEERPEQIEMLTSIIEAFNKQKFAFIEAGTGVGKSLAYLLPAIFQCVHSDTKCVISTHTITLQEQLLQKDIPFILECLNLNLEVVLVKGMGNYLCIRKLFDLLDHASIHTIDQREELLEVEEWAKETSDGSLSDIKKMPQKTSWDKLNCESDACSFVKCPHYKDCFFFKARKKSKDAQLLIANHSLLLADLKAQEVEASGSGILPEYDHLIIDEAHTLEDIATEALAGHISSQAILRKLNDLVSEKGQSGKFQLLKNALYECSPEISSKLIDKVSIDLISEKKQTQSLLIDAFISLGDFLNDQFSDRNNSYQKLTLSPATRTHKTFEDIKLHFIQLIEQLKCFSLSILNTLESCAEMDNPKLKKRILNVLIDTKAIALYFEKIAFLLWDFFHPEDEKNKIYVLEWDNMKSLSAIKMMIIHLNISDVLSEKLFAPRESGVLCSATLTYDHKFDFIQKQLGFKSNAFIGETFIEKLLKSPFNYQNQVLLGIPTDIPDPRTFEYSKVIADFIKKAIAKSQGGAFVLFTSYKALDHCYSQISASLLRDGLLPLKQGDENRNILLKIFKENPNAVLFGTDTFWEGIDVPGFHLRMVILTKLPFPVPTEPIFQAKCKQMEKNGQNPFMEYSIPKAIVKFKQGFGRLIRTKQDFGTILCLDTRLITKAYGRFFLNSLPNCKKIIANQSQVIDQVEQFYENQEKWSVTESNR